jgi:DNA-binding transcriptional LysR family regulator
MFEDLRNFVFVADAGTMAAAAKRAHITQPGLTASMKRLEERLGAQLLTRSRTGSTLTAVGEALLPRAQAVLAAMTDCERAVSELAGLETGTIRIAAGATVCTYYLPRILARFRQAYPRVLLLVSELTSDEIGRRVTSGSVDIGILAYEGGEPWSTEHLVLVSSPKGPYAPSRVQAEDAPFITFPKGAMTRSLLDRVFPHANIVMELGGIAAVKSNVRAGVGVSLLSTKAVERDLRSGQLVIIPHRALPIRRNFSLVHRAERLPPAAQSLLEMLRKARAAHGAPRGRKAST